MADMVVNEIDPRMILRELLGVSVYDSLKYGCSGMAYFQGLPLFHPPQVACVNLFLFSSLNNPPYLPLLY
jgi:hypothetical protein